MRVVSIQSSVAYGYAGNSAATFPLQRLGHEVWAINTVHFSNHTGYGSFHGLVFEPSDVADVVRGVGERGAFAATDVVLSGYLGSPGVAQVVLDAVAAVKAANPCAVYCCDPVMGDLGKGMFVSPGLPELIRSAVVPAADVVTPNAFELAYLAGSGGDPATAVPADVTTLDGILVAVDRLRATGPSVVLVTSIDDAASIAPVAGGSDGEGDTGRLFGRTDSAAAAVFGPDSPAAAALGPDSPAAALGPDSPAAAFGPAATAAFGSDPSTIGMIAVDDSGAYLVRTGRLPLLANGAGDLTAALFVAHLQEAGIETALARTASSVHGVLAETIRLGRVEIALIDAQEAIAHPRCEFPVTRLR
jgi:pyridoxine kinase